MISELCAYCNNAPGTTRDHVPPKGFLRLPYRANLRTVPACARCNTSCSADEEYVRRVMITLMSNNKEADKIFDGPVTRSFERSPNVENAVWDSLGVEDGRPFAHIDTSAFARVATKIVRGLEFSINKHRIPATTHFAFKFYDADEAPQPITEALDSSTPDASDAPNFSFRCARAPDGDHEALWELNFFESFCAAVGVPVSARDV